MHIDVFFGQFELRKVQATEIIFEINDWTEVTQAGIKAGIFEERNRNIREGAHCRVEKLERRGSQ